MKNKLFSTLRMNTQAALIAAVALIFPLSAFSATNGSLGTTSTGSSDISVTVPDLVRITGISDRAFGTWNGSSTMDSNDDVCIYTNKAAATYYITATGSGTGGAFELDDGSSNVLPYHVYYNDVTGTTGEVEQTTAIKSAQQSGADTSSQTCGGGNNANYHVRIVNTDLLVVPSGTYTGTLTIVVSPT